MSPMMHTFAKNILDVEIEVGRTVIWRAKDGDYPVTIAGDLGVSPGGRRYVRSRVPALEFQLMS